MDQAMSGGDDASTSEDPLRACSEASRRRPRGRVRSTRIRWTPAPAPLADVVREHALVHLTPAAAARLRLVHPAWARRLASPLFAVAHAATPRRMSGLFVPTSGFLPFDSDSSADAVPSRTLSFAPASPGSITVLSSTHGLACCFSPADDAYFLCNPATASWAPVPCPPCRPTWPRPAMVVLFDASPYNFRGDYALVCAAEVAPGAGAYCFQVFTSATGAWRVHDAIAPAEGLVAASGVATGAGGMTKTAWWRTSVGTAVGYIPATGRVELVLCPGDSGMWEIGSAGGKLHCAVRDGTDVAVFRLTDEQGISGWEEVARVSVTELLPSRQVKLSESEGSGDDELVSTTSVAVVENQVRRLDDGVRLLGFQGGAAWPEVVVLAGRRLVAFDTGTRRRREVTVPTPEEEEEEQEQEEEQQLWDGVEYAVHTNTLALVAPAVLAGEPMLVEESLSALPDDAEMVAVS